MSISGDSVMYGSIAAVVVTIVIFGYIAVRVIKLINTPKDGS